MSALHKPVLATRAWTSTAVPVGLCMRQIVMCCYLCVATLWAVQSCCSGVALNLFCLVRHKALLSTDMLRISSNFKLFCLCKCFSFFLPFILTRWQTHRDKLTSFPPEKSALTAANNLTYGNGKSWGSPNIFISDKRDCYPTVRCDAMLLVLL